jgi:hypothetical protein
MLDGSSINVNKYDDLLFMTCVEHMLRGGTEKCGRRTCFVPGGRRGQRKDGPQEA